MGPGTVQAIGRSMSVDAIPSSMLGRYRSRSQCLLPHSDPCCSALVGLENSLYGSLMSKFQHAAGAAILSCSEECASYEAGHDLHPIRARAAAATSAGWVDTVVEAVSASGIVSLIDVFTAEHYKVWNHHDAVQAARPGDAVALHRDYSVLAIGSTRWSVRTIDHVAQLSRVTFAITR